MRKVTAVVLVAIIVLALSSGVFAFQNEPDGFRGLEWGDPPGEDMVFKEDFTITRFLYPYIAHLAGDDVNVCRRKNDKLRLGGAKLEPIDYLFYKNQFMGVRIETKEDYRYLEDVVELKYGRYEEEKDTWDRGYEYKWSGDIATVALYKKYKYNEDEGILAIYSVKVYEQKEADETHKREEETRREEEERRKVAEEGLADFDYIPETKEEKESDIKEKLKAEKLEKRILNGEEVSDEEKIKPILPEVQPFFDLSTPENTVRSFTEAIMLEDDSKKAAECWSRRTPEVFITLLINRVQKAFRKGLKEEVEEASPEVKSMIQNPEAVEFGLNLFSYEKEQIDEESFYVWYVLLDGSDSKEDLTFRVVKEDGNWKILMLKGVEDILPFSSLLEKVEVTERKFKDFSTPENTLRTFWEAAILRDKELMEQCWSKEIPRHMLDEISEGMDSIFAEYDLEERKSFLGKMTYKVDRYIDDSTCYVYAINEEEESRIKFKVEKEEEQWKILMPAEWEENEEPGKGSGEREGIRGSGQGPEIEGAIAGREIRRWLQPDFPRSAEEQGKMDGKVRVKIWVLSSGEVVETAIIQTSGVPEFD